MVYRTGHTDAIAQPAVFIRSEIEAALSAHGGWQFVKEFVSSSFTCRTWKCLGASSGLGTDFFVTMFWNTAQTATGATYWSCHEQFNATSNLLIRACAPPAVTYTPEATWASAFGATGYLPNASQIPTSVTTTVSATSMDYWIKVTKRGIFVKTSSDTYGTYVGLFEPLVPHAQEFPIIQWSIGSSSAGTNGSVSRRPSCSGVSMSSAFSIRSEVSAANTLSALISSLPFGGVLYGGKAYGSRFYFKHATTTNGEGRGAAYDCLVFAQEADVARGDSVLVEGRKFVCIDDAVSTGLWVDTEAA